MLTLKDMTQGSGCTPRTVRYYERQGLLRALRSAGGHRLFAVSELERLNFIISLREAGWTLEEVTEFLAIREASGTDAVAVERLEAELRRQADRLERKIAVLQRLRADFRCTSALLSVCEECSATQPRVECEACGRVPPLEELPRCFRLVWRARELEGAEVYDEAAADGSEDDDDASDSAEA